MVRKNCSEFEAVRGPFQLKVLSPIQRALFPLTGRAGRRAKPGRFGSLALALKNWHFGGDCSRKQTGKPDENVTDSGCLRVSRLLVNKASGDSGLQVLGNKAQTNSQIVPVLPVYRALLSPYRVICSPCGTLLIVYK